MIATAGSPLKKVLLLSDETEKENEEEGEVVLHKGKFIVCCIFVLHNKNLILMRQYHITEVWTVVND